MKTGRPFDARLDFDAKRLGKSRRIVVVRGGEKSAAGLSRYAGTGREAGPFLARIVPDKEAPVRWGDRVEVRSPEGELLGEGMVLHPLSPDPKKITAAKRLEALAGLDGDVRAALRTLVEMAGAEGLREAEILDLFRLPLKDLEAAAGELEESGAIRILSFSPLFLLAQEALAYLCGRMVAFVKRYHEIRPDERGIPLEKVRRRFNLGDKVFLLALKTLVRGKHLEVEGDLARLPGFKMPLGPEEEKILAALEEMCYKGEFYAVSVEDLQARFHLPAARIQSLLSILVERRKVVMGREGYLLHSDWLDEMVAKVRGLGKRELTVGDFKALTGLSRKYAIPLLELLDEMGVTRRRGTAREVLPIPPKSRQNPHNL